MIPLSDASTGVAIPYSSVWATISKGGKIVFDERLWPMISRYMGPHYGNNVSLPVRHLPPHPARQPARGGASSGVQGALAPAAPGEPDFRWVPKV